MAYDPTQDETNYYYNQATDDYDYIAPGAASGNGFDLTRFLGTVTRGGADVIGALRGGRETDAMRQARLAKRKGQMNLTPLLLIGGAVVLLLIIVAVVKK